MDGFKAFKYYTAIKLHFTNPQFNVFVNRGRVKGSRAAFLSRNDHLLFEKLAQQLPNDKDFIQYIAANFMYGNPNMVYSSDEAMANFKEFQRRKQSITRVFTNDLDTITSSGAQYEFSGLQIPDVVQLLMAKRITLETMVILNDMDAIVDKMRQSTHIALLLGDDLLRIEKSKGFVKYDPYKVMGPYQQFLEDAKR